MLMDYIFYWLKDDKQGYWNNVEGGCHNHFFCFFFHFYADGMV